jgi:hypothetical protein
MKKITPLIFSLLSSLALFGQANGGWGTCEFTTVAAMNAFDPSGSNYTCKKVFVQATDEHYQWDGAAWVQVSPIENIYNTNDTLTSDRTLEGDANSLFFTGLDSMYIEGTNIELTASNILTFFAQNTIEFELDATDGKGIYIAADGDVGIGTSSPDAKLDVEGGQVRFSDYGTGTYEDTTAVYLLGVEADGDIIEMNTAKSSRIFYPPALVVDASSTGSKTLDLHQEYIDLFGSPAVVSSGAPSTIPTYNQDELYYYVTDYDNSIFSGLSIDANGLLSYTVDAVPTDNCAILNVVFVVKEP